MKRNPLPNEHTARQKPPDLFKTFRRSKSFRNKPLPPGISIIYGIRKEKGPRGGSTDIQSFRFDKNKWGVREAKKWLKDNGFETKIEKATKKTTRKKNPYNSEEDILNKLKENLFIENIKLIGEGSYSRVYYFYLNRRSFILNDILLDKGEYAIKILLFKSSLNDTHTIKELKLMSNYGIIPKIFYIDINCIIMKYIKGLTLKEFRKKYPDYPMSDIYNKIENLRQVWWKVGKFEHGDMHGGNVLITENMKVYLIDPI